jgi:hypothetical protein
MRYVLIAAAAGMGLACGGGVQPPVAAPAPAPAIPERKWEGPPVEADDLYRQYKADGADAAAKYGNRLISIRLRVDDARQGSSEVELIQHLSKPNDFPQVTISIPASEAGKVRTGEWSTFTGTVYTTGSTWVSLKGKVAG